METQEIDVIKSYMEFIEQAYEKRRKSVSILNELDQVTPERINFCLASFTEVSDTLLSEYSKELVRCEDFKKEFNHWKDEKFLLARSKLRADIAKSQALSQREIDAQAYVDNKEEWKRQEDKLFFMEAKCDLYRRLRENWTNQSFMLKEISENMKVEMHTLNADRIVNKSDAKVIIPLRRQLKS